MKNNKNNLAHGFPVSSFVERSHGSEKKSRGSMNQEKRIEELETQMASMHGWARIKRNLITLAVIVGLPMALYAITKSYSFTAGTVAKASEINKNFDDIYARLDAMEGKTWRLIYEKDVTVATTSINVTGLDGDVDKEYRILTRFVSAGGPAFNLLLNNDTATNYGYQTSGGLNATATASRATSLTGFQLCNATTGNLCTNNGFIFAKSGYSRLFQSFETRNVTATSVELAATFFQVWNNTGANITSMQFISTVANGIGAGSHIEIWARR